MLCIIGCEEAKPGPASVTETSAARPALTERIQFVENYVTFKRTYLSLDYDIFYQNNGGGFVSGPSDWDVRLVATVPADEIDQWVIKGKRDTSLTTPAWVATTAPSIDARGITEWYVDGTRSVGIDRKRNVVAYRAYTM